MSVNLRTVYAFAREMYPRRLNDEIKYGTAGFRTRHDRLEHVMYRMGLLACLRSRAKGGQVIGVMITASHNAEEDNGVKLVDPKGEMLEQRWEQLATDLANVDDQELEAHIKNLIETENINISAASKVFIGMDNRYHSPGLLKAVSDGVLALKGNPKEFGILTTPMLHYLVVCANTSHAYGTATEEGYYIKLITAFKKLRGKEYDNKNYNNLLYFDGANEVGTRKMKQFLKRMDNCLNVKVFNSGEGKINHQCGADYVKVQQRPPIGMPDMEPNTRCVSVDGDADRIVYFFVDEKNQFHLLDGDRIATLIAGYLQDFMESVDLQIKIGLVQTAYANGASTDYIKNKLRVPVACVPTGVKHLHHKAMQYDIGIYFEANGHGTVVFSEYAKGKIEDIANDHTTSDERSKAARKLLHTIDLINETVGDAISDMLLVEIILQTRGWDLEDWLATYTDLPNLQLKVSVAERSVITTKDAERICVTPEGLQDEINQLVAKYSKGRAFVRPSGTEDIVRVYAEAATKEETTSLAYEVAAAVHRLAGGVGPVPEMQNGTANSH